MTAWIEKAEPAFTRRTRWVFAITGVTAATALVGWRMIPRIPPHDPLTRYDIAEIVKEQLQEALHTQLSSSFEGLPGFSLQSVIRLHQMQQSRQYIFETADANSALYSTPEMLTWTIYNSGEPYPFRAPLGINGVPWERFVFLSLELGTTDRSTIFRALVNGKQVSIQELPFKIDVRVRDSRLVIGADSNGRNGAKVDISEFAAFSRSLSSAEVEQWQRFFATQFSGRFVQFNGKQWMRRGADQNLYQPNTSVAPLFRESGNSSSWRTQKPAQDR